VIQIGIVLITITALSVLVVVVSRGLLGRPEMFVLGNGSYGNRLVWFDPAGPAALGMPWILTVSVWWYRVLMLLWGLWLARSVIRWLGKGWRSFTHRTAWRHNGSNEFQAVIDGLRVEPIPATGRPPSGPPQADDGSVPPGG